MLYELNLIKSSKYFIEFIFFMINSRRFASGNVSNTSEYFNIHGIPVDVNFEWLMEPPS
ncbi:MAG: hypothetical protein ABIO04_03500 [Ferruginibacter sp.]